MGENNKNGAFATYLTYVHITELEERDFEELGRQVRNERWKYEYALKEVYALKGVLNARKREKAIELIDKNHDEFNNKVTEIIDKYMDAYQKTKEEWQKIAPKYHWREEEFSYNTEEFRRFCNDFAKIYGDWFWAIRLRHDPLDDVSYGSASIAELQNMIEGKWYYMMEEWNCIPYGARLLKYYMDGLPDWRGDSTFIDLTFRIMLHRGLYINRPEKSLLDTMKYHK